jgi:hypothetical protein
MMISEKFFGKKDEFKEMHRTLQKHGYTTSDYKTYTHSSGAKTHLRTHSLSRSPETGRMEVTSTPVAAHSHSKERFISAKALDKHLKHYHSIKEDAPTNSMGASSSTSGPINTYDPLLKTRKKKIINDVIRRVGKTDGGKQ